MASPTNTPTSSRPVDRVFSPTSSPSAARRFDDRDRASIISTSTKGWAPLNTKRSSTLASSIAASPSGSPARNSGSQGQGPRRTSSSFKHVRHNNLVSNSVFKSATASLGSPGSQSPPQIKIGLGIGVGSVSGTRKTSGSKGTRKVSSGSSSGGRKVSGGSRNVVKAGSTPRKVSLTEDLRTSNGVTPSSSSSPSSRKTATPRQSTGLHNLASSGYVSRSPFLQHTSSFEGSTTPSSSAEKNWSSGSPEKTSPGKQYHLARQGDVARAADRFGSPDKKGFVSPSRSGGARHMETSASPISDSKSVIRSDAVQQKDPWVVSASSANDDHDEQPPLLANVASPSPVKSSLTSRRLRGPRVSDPSVSSQIYGSSTYSSSSISRRAAGLGSGPYQQKTVTFRDVADVKEFETESSDGGEWEDEGEYEEGESWDEVLMGPPGTDQPHSQTPDYQHQEEPFMDNTPSPEMDLSGLRRYGSLNSRPSPARSPLQRERGPVYAEQEREEDEGYAGYAAQMGHVEQQTYEDESTTANFIDSLYADGYLSPPQSHSETSLAGLVTASGTMDRLGPVLEVDGEGQRMAREVDERGIPLGRTHHADRAAAAHEARRQYHQGQGVHQPTLPRIHNDDAELGEPMLRSGDVRAPATAVANTYAQEDGGVTAHQDGQFVDPFVTIQTATRVNRSDAHGVSGLPQTSDSTQNRQEDGVPLGRTSHAERAKVARLLATRGLGLGMPARPMVPFVLGGIGSQLRDGEASEDGSIGSDEEYDDRGYSIPELSKMVAKPEDRFDPGHQAPRSQHVQQLEQVSLAPLVSPFPQQGDSEMYQVDLAGSVNGKRALPKPPKPTPVVGMPSPVEKIERHRGTESASEERVTSPTKMFGLSLPFSLPALTSSTSPLFTAGAEFKAASESGSEGSADHDLYDQDEPEQALTPPKNAFETQQQPSPHRIPEFDFESPSTRRNKEVEGSDEDDPTSEAFKLVEAALPKLSLGGVTLAEKSDVRSRLSGLFGERKDDMQHSSSSNDSLNDNDHIQVSSVNSRVRPRISKDVIRARLEEKRSMTNLVNAKPVAGEDDVFLSPPRNSTKDSKEKSLPPPLETTWFGKIDSPARPGLRARQDTMSAEEVLQNVPEPKSALEQLVSNFTFTEFDEYAQAATPPASRDSFKLQQATGVHVVRHATSENVIGNKVRSSQRLALSPSGLAQIEEASTADTTTLEQEDITLGDLTNTGSRPKRRRSMSTGDARPRGPQSGGSTIDNRMSLLDTFKFEDSSSILSAFEKELNERNNGRPYTVREHKTVYASADDKVKHNIAGDVDKGRAWRQLRKASDINQYAKEIKAMKAKASNSSKSFGTIFVKVLGIESLSVPMPKEDTSFCITLDNGIDYIRTPYSTLKDGVKINQEFALVEHANFEFALGLEIRRDSHVNKMIQVNASPAVPIRPNVGSRASMVTETASIQSSTRGLKSLFSSPRKMSKAPKALIVPEPTPEAAPDNIARYFSDGDSTVGRTHIAFKPIAKNCDARLLEIRYPMFGMYQPPPQTSASMPATTTHRGSRHSVQTLPQPAAPPAPLRKQVCKITLQIFRLPPLPGLTDAQLPQSIDECLRGMRHHAWHEHEYHEGVMTQNGGDCVAPRRRPFKLIGGNLVASNAVTKKTVFSIDLRKATSLVDENADASAMAKGGQKQSIEDELEAGYAKMPRSFTLRFEDGDFITFWTDTDDEKAGWMKALGSLIGKVPSNPLWAELLAARQRQLKARSASRASLAAIAAGPGTEELKSAPAVPAK